MEKLVRESEYFVAWLVFWLCATAGGVILLTSLGAIVAFVLGATGFDLQSTQATCVILGSTVIGVPISYGLFRLFVGVMIVKKIQRRLASTVAPRPCESPLPYETPQ